MLSMGLLSRLTKQIKTEMKPSEEAIQVVLHLLQCTDQFAGLRLRVQSLTILLDENTAEVGE